MNYLMKNLLKQFQEINKFYRKYLIYILFDYIKDSHFFDMYIKKYNIFDDETFNKLKFWQVEFEDILKEDEKLLFSLEKDTWKISWLFLTWKSDRYYNWKIVIKKLNFDFFSLIESKILKEIIKEIPFVTINWERKNTWLLFESYNNVFFTQKKLKILQFPIENHYLFLSQKLLNYSNENKELFELLFKKYWLVFSYIYSNFDFYFQVSKKDKLSYDYECFSWIFRMKIAKKLLQKSIKKAIKLWYLNKEENDKVIKFFKWNSIQAIQKNSSQQNTRIVFSPIKENNFELLKEKVLRNKTEYLIDKFHVCFDSVKSPFLINWMLFWFWFQERIRLNSINFYEIISWNYEFIKKNYDIILKNYINYLKSLKKNNQKWFQEKIENILWLAQQSLYDLFQQEFIYLLWKNTWIKDFNKIVNVFDKYSKIIFDLNSEAINSINFSCNLLENFNKKEKDIDDKVSDWYDLIFKWIHLQRKQVINEIEHFINKNNFSRNWKKFSMFYQYFRDSFYSTNDFLKIITFKNYLISLEKLSQKTKNKNILKWIEIVYWKKIQLRKNYFKYFNTIIDFIWYYNFFKNEKNEYLNILEIIKNNKKINYILWKENINEIYNFWKEYIIRYWKELNFCYKKIKILEKIN